MNKLTKSLFLFKERTCNVSMVLDCRSNRTATKWPLAVRFTIDRKAFYIPVGNSYSKRRFSDICNASRSSSDNYRTQKEWIDMYTEKYSKILTNLNKNGMLTFEMVRQAILYNKVTLNPEIQENVVQKSQQSFLGVWRTIIKELQTENNGARYTTSESYQCALKSFMKVLGENTVKGFRISTAEIQLWKDGMHNGIVGKGGRREGKISDTTAGIYLRCCRAVWNRCMREGYLHGTPYPFSNKKEVGAVSIPRSAQRKQNYLNIEQMTELYNTFINKNYPSEWAPTYVNRAHYSLGLFLAQYLCNGFNLADAGRLVYDNYYYQTNGKAFRFHRKKTAERSADGSLVTIPIIAPLQRILNDIAAPPIRGGFVFPDILKGTTTEAERRRRTQQENANVQDRLIRICHESLHWDASIRPSGTWARHSFATNLHNAGVDLDYISECMGHSATVHAITQIYIEHYPLETMVKNNMKLLQLSTVECEERKTILDKLSSLTTSELINLMNIQK